MSKDNPRFKVDYSEDAYFPFALYVSKPKSFGRQSWKYVTIFQTLGEARAYYDKIKNLPEYLD